MTVVVDVEGSSYTGSSISRYTKALRWGPKRLLQVLDGGHINESVGYVEIER